jgi:hypothetical protein
MIVDATRRETHTVEAFLSAGPGAIATSADLILDQHYPLQIGLWIHTTPRASTWWIGRALLHAGRRAMVGEGRVTIAPSTEHTISVVLHGASPGDGRCLVTLPRWQIDRVIDRSYRRVTPAMESTWIAASVDVAICEALGWGHDA